MLHLSATFLITALVIVVNQAGGQVIQVHQTWDQIAEESKPTRTAITLVDGPKYVTPNPNHPSPSPTTVKLPHKPDLGRPPSKPPIQPSPNLRLKTVKYVEKRHPRPVYYSHVQKIPPRLYGNTKPPHFKSPNGSYNYPKVIPLNGHQRPQYYSQPIPGRQHQQSLSHSASSNKPLYISSTSPKFSLPIQTINGIPSTKVRPPKLAYNTTTSTTTTTTIKPLRNKRIWPKHILDKLNGIKNSATVNFNNTLTYNDTNSTNKTDHEVSASQHHRRYFTTTTTTTSTEATARVYRRVTRIPKHKSTPKAPSTSTNSTSSFIQNDWIPIIPSHYPKMRRKVPMNRRSDVEFVNYPSTPAEDRRMLYLHSFGLIPMQKAPVTPGIGSKKLIFFKRKRQLNPYSYSGFSRKPYHSRIPHHRVIYGDLHSEGSHPRVVTKIKHHHHHHHHKYIKTVEKPVKVPFKVEVPKPYPVPVPVEKIVNKVVEKKVPYPVSVEKKVPYPVQVKVPQPIPVKVVEKEYVPKPYPVVQRVPVIKEVKVKVPQPVHIQVEKVVPYPVHIKVPVPFDRPVAYPVTVEKRVPVAVPYKVLVPQPYPVETKVPYPVPYKVKEPVEVIRHVQVPVKVPVPQPIKVPHPVPITIEKKVPYPVEVEKRVPVPFKVYVPQRVEVEKRVPVYIPKPYPVEKKVHVPVKVPIQVPVHVPIYLRQFLSDEQGYYSPTKSFESVSSGESAVTDVPQHTVTVHGNGAFGGFSSRSDSTTPSTLTAT